MTSDGMGAYIIFHCAIKLDLWVAALYLFVSYVYLCTTFLLYLWHIYLSADAFMDSEAAAVPITDIYIPIYIYFCSLLYFMHT